MSTLQPDSVHRISSELPAHPISTLRTGVPNTSITNRSPSPSPGLPHETANSSTNSNSQSSQNLAPSTSASASASASGSGKTQTVFIHKLYDMLHDQSISHLIWWAPSNDSFCLLPGEDFSKVLSQYFKHTNIASFIRQLNMYGFHKVNDTFQNSEKDPSTPSSNSAISAGSSTTSSNKWEFRHSTNQFRKGDIESLKLIKRRSSKNINSHKEVVNLKSLPPTSNPMQLDHSHQPHPHYPYNSYHSEDDSIPPSNPPKSAENPLLQYHQSLQIQHQSLLNANYLSQIHPGASLQPSGQQALNSPHPALYHPIPSSTTPIPDPSTGPLLTHSPHNVPPQYSHNHSQEGPSHAAGSTSHLHYHPHVSQQSGTNTPNHPVPPPLLNHSSFENSINFKFIDLNTQVNALKSELATSNSKYESIQNELKRNLMDTLQILEMLESFVQLSLNSQLKLEPNADKPADLSQDKPRINPDIFNRSDNNRTPVSSTAAQNLREKEDETNTSPMSVTHPKKTNSNNSVPIVDRTFQSIQNEISRFKANLHQRISQPSINNINTYTASGYHLNNLTPSNAIATKKPSNSNIQIVPQYYPLNPHYTIYNPHSEAYRHAGKLSSSLLLSNDDPQPSKPAGIRNIGPNDPLQPQPSRHNSKILYDEASNAGPGVLSVTSTGASGTSYRDRAESKSYSPLTVGGANAGNSSSSKLTHSLQPAVNLPNNQPSNLGASASSPNNPSSSSSRSSIFDTVKSGHTDHIKSYHQYPFPNMSNSGGSEIGADSNAPHNPNFQPPNNHITHPHNSNRLSGSRTNSLPNPLINHVSSPDNAPTSIGQGSSNLNGYQYQAQRNSFTSMYEHNRQLSQTSLPHNNLHLPPPTGSYQSSHNSFALAPIPKTSSNSGGIPTINALTNSPQPNSPKVEIGGQTHEISDQQIDSHSTLNVESKNQLPSVSELDKSISKPLSSQISSPIKSETSKLHSLLHKNEPSQSNSKVTSSENQPDFKKRKL